MGKVGSLACIAVTEGSRDDTGFVEGMLHMTSVSLVIERFTYVMTYLAHLLHDTGRRLLLLSIWTPIYTINI
jgi:hypothetical protein